MSDQPATRATVPLSAPRRVIAIACSPRSGSNLMAEAFNATGVLGHCDEMLSWDVLFDNPRRHGERSLLVRMLVSKWVQRLRRGRLRGQVPLGRRAMGAFLRHYPDTAMSTTGTFTVKLFWHAYQWHLLDNGLDLHHWGAPVTWIRLVRRDRLAQAVSHLRASQTRRWRAGGTATSDEVFDDAGITERLRWMVAAERAWDEYFAVTGEVPLLVDYSDLDTDYDRTMRRVLDHLGYESTPVPPPQLERQRDAVTDEWIERYRSLHPEYAD